MKRNENILKKFVIIAEVMVVMGDFVLGIIKIWDLLMSAQEKEES